MEQTQKMTKAQRMGCKQPEAFCLMLYRSRDSYRQQILWNSRDAVTPFIIVVDGVELLHQEWGMDFFAPDHQVHVGDRVFVDTTMEMASEFAARRIAFVSEAMPETAPKTDEEYTELQSALIDEFYGDGHQPTTVLIETQEQADELNKAERMEGLTPVRTRYPFFRRPNIPNGGRFA